jgi:membrane protein CcdC involved in cytochrome C biogenesis
MVLNKMMNIIFYYKNIMEKFKVIELYYYVFLKICKFVIKNDNEYYRNVKCYINILLCILKDWRFCYKEWY